MVQNQLMGHPPELSDTSVSSVRVIYPDLHGVAARQGRADDASSTASPTTGSRSAAVMGTDLRHTPVLGGEDRLSRPDRPPDLSTLTLVPWEPGVASCIADLHPVEAGTDAPPTRAARSAARSPPTRRSASPRSSGPELEFFLCERDDERPTALRRYVDNLSMVYTVGPQADPRGVVRQITEALAASGHGHLRRQPRVHELAVRDQPAPRARP